MSSKIEDYDTFIDSLDSNTTYSVYEGDSVYTASLFDNTAQIELPKESLVSDYVSLQKKLLSNYDKSIVFYCVTLFAILPIHSEVVASLKNRIRNRQEILYE